VRSRDEVGQLAASFNAMSRSLAEAHAENRGLLDGLERKVEERTAALKEAQRQVVETEKLASLGQLSASIAHEINNPLSGILTFSRLLIKNLEEGPVGEPTRHASIKSLKLIARETERCRVIVRNLLDFARSKPPEVKEVDLDEVFREALSLTAHKLELTGIAVESSLSGEARLAGDFGQLRQALVNLVLNACDAMPQGGRLRVGTRVREGGELEAEVRDSGCGIPPEALQKVFDPFYTTKEMGTGLGLPVVRGVAEKHGGRIEIESEPGAGTAVRLILPARRAAPLAPGAGSGP
jgi:two-component system NtrC family sensor kinase